MYYRRWINIIRDVIESLDVTRQPNGAVFCSFRWLPGAGGYYDQDDYIMNTWLLVKMCYTDAVNDESFMAQVAKRKG